MRVAVLAGVERGDASDTEARAEPGGVVDAAGAPCVFPRASGMIRLDSIAVWIRSIIGSGVLKSGSKPMAVKTRKQRIEDRAINRPRKAKFQADLAPAEDRAVRLLKEELQLASNSDFLSDAVALFRWAVYERKLGHRIISESATGERNVLLFPRLERVAPDLVLPRVEIEWSERELESLAELASAADADRPTDALIRAIRD